MSELQTVAVSIYGYSPQMMRWEHLGVQYVSGGLAREIFRAAVEQHLEGLPYPYTTGYARLFAVAGERGGLEFKITTKLEEV